MVSAILADKQSIDPSVIDRINITFTVRILVIRNTSYLNLIKFYSKCNNINSLQYNAVYVFVCRLKISSRYACAYVFMCQPECCNQLNLAAAKQTNQSERNREFHASIGAQTFRLFSYRYYIALQQ